MSDDLKLARICVVIGRTRHKMMQVELQEAIKGGAKLIELRLDFLAKAPDFKRLLANKSCPVVATVRRPKDGGRWSGTEDARRTLLRQCVVSGFDWIDLETDVIDSIPRFQNVKRIVSLHDMRGMPEDLEKTYERMCTQDADVVKIAVTAHTPADNIRVLKLLQNAPKPTVAFCMGDMGFPSRILSLRFGAPFIYAAFNRERGVAPGLPTLDDARKVYRAEEINKDTRVFGVVGDPVGHSLSPLVHNRAFRELGINAVYLPFRVPRGELEGFLKNFDMVPVQGYSVTIPHKEAAAKVATETDDLVDLIGAANTLIRDDAGWKAYNTDAPAAIESLKAGLPPSPDGSPGSLHSRTILVLGAGGVARAICHGLRSYHPAMYLSNRTPERAQQLAGEVDCRPIDWDARNAVLSDTLINCTSVGMHPNVDDSPIHNSFLKPGIVVFDTIYTPENTMLVKQARERGCRVLTGVDMFVRQAALQFELFTGQKPPVKLMEKVVRRALSPIRLEDED